MVASRPSEYKSGDSRRGDSIGPAPGRTGTIPAGPAVGPPRQRLPSTAQLAKLLINGILTLPRNYRRGMFLDIWV